MQERQNSHSNLLHTEKIIADRKKFYLDLKQNARGLVVKITEDVGGNRDTIMVPAEILGDFIAADLDVDSSVLASRSVIEAILRGSVDAEESLMSWQYELLKDTLAEETQHLSEEQELF